ncbi:hypothetical protein LIA77_03366 [Sarocladium implicatum]|nr:hypothetical protein LIA77_03366 [Sarocladium implicatum]
MPSGACCFSHQRQYCSELEGEQRSLSSFPAPRYQAGRSESSERRCIRGGFDRKAWPSQPDVRESRQQLTGHFSDPSKAVANAECVSLAMAHRCPQCPSRRPWPGAPPSCLDKRSALGLKLDLVG